MNITRNFIFIHGTGCRQPAYDNTFKIIQQQLTAKNISAKLHQCYWGEDYGSRLNEDGNSIPEFDTNRGIGDELTDEEYELGLWNILYQDPLFELSIVSLQSKVQSKALTAEENLGEIVIHVLSNFSSSEKLKTNLEEEGITNEIFNQAKKDILRDGRNSINKISSQDVEEYLRAIARAWIAQSVFFNSENFILYSREDVRDKLVNSLLTELSNFLLQYLRTETESDDDLIVKIKSIIESGTEDKSIGKINKTIKEKFGKLLKSAKEFSVNLYLSPLSLCFIPMIRKNKRSNWEEHAAKVGDIMMYQARGQVIRNYIRETIEKIKQENQGESIIVLAHSLGGIACVDLFLESDPPQIDLLVTIGSQAPILYEWNALVNKPWIKGSTLPDSFPNWLNIYDPNDFLSYKIDKIFGDDPRLKDVSVDNKKRFPDSHDGYWENGEVWGEIFKKIVEIGK